MNHYKFLGIFVFLLAHCLTYAENVTKTLSSPSGDKVTVVYNISRKNDKVIICFSDVKQTLSRIHEKIYKNNDEIVVLFFSRNGSFDEREARFFGENTKAFISPAGLTYNKPTEDDGFFVVNQKPELVFDSKATEAVTLSIPFYLAYHPKRGFYDIFEACGTLDVPIVPPTSSSKKGSQQKTIEYSVEEEEESSFSFEDEARQRIAQINTLLDFQEGSFSQDLINEIANLAALREKVKDRKVIMAIDETLVKCNEKKAELRQNAQHQENINKKEEAKNQENAEERQLYLSCMDTTNCLRYLEIYGDEGKYSQQVKEKLKTLRDQKKTSDAKQKHRTIWMIIGGGLMAALLFVGNQAMQSFRNIKTQRSILEMQQDITRRATGTAKRRAKSIIHNKTHQAMNATRNKGRDLMQKGVEKSKSINLKKKDGSKGVTQANGSDDTNKAKTVKAKTNNNKQFSI